MNTSLPELGIAVVYVPGLEPLLEPGTRLVDAIEIEPQTLWHYHKQSPRPYRLPTKSLQHVRDFGKPIIAHSVGFAVGGTHRASADFTHALADTIHELDAVWASEHLSFTHVGNGDDAFHTGFMLPSQQSVRGAQEAAASIRHLSARLPVPFAVETTVNYLKPRPGELSDGEFVALTVEMADCGILLDLHNIWTNARNGRQPVEAFLDSIPLERVWEIHLGGGFERDGYWLDAHSGPVPDPVWELTETVIARLPNLKALTYEIFPSFLPLFGVDGVARQLERMRDIWRGSRNRPPAQAKTASSHLQVATEQPSPADWELSLGSLVAKGQAVSPLALELAQDPSVPLIQQMVWRFRAGTLLKSLSTLLELLRLSLGEAQAKRLFDDYFKASTPQPFASEEALGFIAFLRDVRPDVPYLDEVMRYEERAMQAVFEDKPQLLRLDCDLSELLAAMAEGKLPQHLPHGDYEVEITP